MPDMPDKDLTKREKIKRHLNSNKKIYVSVAGGTAIGMASLFVCTGGHVIISDGVKRIRFQWKSPNTAIRLERRSYQEPIPVRWKKTGEDFRSIRHASEVTGKTTAAISKDIHGSSKYFEQLPNSVFNR